MARRPFPADPAAYAVVGGQWAAQQAGAVVAVYLDENPGGEPAALTPATDIRHPNGDPVTAPLTINAYSEMPGWLSTDDGPDSMIVTINGGPARRVYAADRIDVIDARVTYLEGSIGGGAVTSVAARTGDVVLTTADIGGLDTALSGKAASTHSHAQSDVTGLSTSLAGKSDTSHTHTQPGILRRTSAAYSSMVTPDISTSDLLDVGTLTGNVTIANPTGSPVDGQILRLRLAQDAAGGRTVTFGSAYRYGTDVTASLVPTGANTRWVMMVMYHAAAAEWWVVSIVRGY